MAAWLSGLTNLAGKSGGQQSNKITPTDINVNSVGVNLGEFIGSDNALPVGAPRTQPSLVGAGGLGGQLNTTTLIIIGVAAVLLLRKKGGK